MHRSKWTAMLVLAMTASTPAAAVVLTGMVRSEGAQPIFTPPSISSPVVLRSYLDDGSQVKKGDPVLRIDAGQAAAQLQSLHDQIEQARSKNAKDLADRQLNRVDAALALVKAQADEATAKVDAAIPGKLISALDYDRYQGEYKRTRREAELAASRLADARAAELRSQHDGDLQLRKLQMQLQFNQDQVDTATVYAKQDGTVVHAFMTVSFGSSAKGRYEQGSTSMPGTKVGEVVAPGGRHSVRAWALQSDRSGLKKDQLLQLHFDALPGIQASARITAISGTANSKPEWGDGQYYQVDIAIDPGMRGLQLLPGMSVRVDTDAKPSVAKTAVARRADKSIQASGEIYARHSIAIMPPQIKGLWRLNITQMAGDGEKVHKGQPIVVFAGGNLMQKLPAKQSELAEKQRALDKLRLGLADQERQVTLDGAEARADADKARRKAEQPEQYVPGVEYKKLVIDRARAEKKLSLTRQRATVANRDRAAQLRQAQAEVTLLEHQVKTLQSSLAQLQVMAPRDGILLHQSSWNGDKIDTGSQVWRGMSVGDMPDMKSLAVRASLPERDLTRVHVGQKVQVILSGGTGRRMPGVIADIGNSVHSKSRAEAVPVIDLRIRLQHLEQQLLKPGMPLRVEIPLASNSAASQLAKP